MFKKWFTSTLYSYSSFKGFQFNIIYKSKKKGSKARIGLLQTPHGSFETPSFVPVGTNASMKCISTSTMDNIYKKTKSNTLMFCNTYHLMLHPGGDIIEKAGGLHKFMNYNYPLITDSGGFQVFSLAYGSVNQELSTGKHLNDLETKDVIKKQRKFSDGSSVIKINENGVLFKSYRNGEKILLTPETSIQAQKQFGADIIIPFDELPPYHISYDKLKDSLDRTHRWQKRSLDEHLLNPKHQAIYGIIHGGMNEDFRKESTNFVNSNEFNGIAIGGSLGKNKSDVANITKYVCNYTDPSRPIHLLGIGDMESIENCIPFGIDTFDSAYPTRCARHGLLFTNFGNIKIGKTIFKDNYESIDNSCPCTMCKNHTKSYIHHLYKANEPTYSVLATEHNVTFYLNKMKEYRNLILTDKI